MSVYLISRFERINDVTNKMPPRSDLSSMMTDSMDLSDATNLGDVGKGKWFIAKCVTTNGSDDNRAENEFYLVYYSTKGGSIITNSKLVAAPCPPFCHDDGGKNIPISLMKIESEIELIKKTLEVILEKLNHNKLPNK